MTNSICKRKSMCIRTGAYHLFIHCLNSGASRRGNIIPGCCWKNHFWGVSYSLCQVHVFLRYYVTRQMKYSVCVGMSLSVSVSQTYAVIQPSHKLRFPGFSPGSARLVSASGIWRVDVGSPRCCSKQRESLKVKSESVSRSVVSDSLWPQRVCNAGSSAHGILQTRILEWVTIPFSRGSSWPRDWTQVSRIAGRFFNFWATREA